MLRLLTALCGALVAASAFSQANFFQHSNDHILVRFLPGYGAAGRQAAAQMGARYAGEVTELGVVRLQLPRNLRADDALRFLWGLPFVDLAEPDYVARAYGIPNDPGYPSQWGLAKVGAPSAWDVSQGDDDVVIAIVDTGVDLDHGDLAPKLTDGYDFVNSDSLADDDNGHGTHCAGIAAAATNNGNGVAGMGFNCSLMPVKVLDASGTGTYYSVAAGIVWATDNGADVISLSLGGPAPSETLLDAVEYAWSQGVVVVAAAGNDNSNQPSYPAYYELAIAVGATDSNDMRASFSNYGEWVDVAAPGTAIYSTYNNGGYATLSGTSMATPLVAGLVGLLRADSRFEGASAARERLEATCKPVGEWLDHGRVDAGAALGDGEPTPDLTSLTVVPSQAWGGTYGTGTVTLGGPAPDGGATVLLSSSSPYVSVPESVTVESGDTSATFELEFGNVSSSVSVTVLASLGSVSKNASVTVKPLLRSLTLEPARVKGGQTSTATVRLNGPAPGEGVEINVSTSGPAEADGTVFVPGGASSAAFAVETAGASSNTTATVTVSFAGVSRSANLTILASGLQSVAVEPGTLVGGFAFEGLVTLDAPAGEGGAVVTLTASNGVVVPSTVTVPQGERTAGFAGTTPAVTRTTKVKITAQLGRSRQQTRLTLLPYFATFTATPTTLFAGGGSLGTVTLNAPAPDGGLTLTVGSSSEWLTAPATVTVPAGESSATFEMVAGAVTKRARATVSVSYGGVTKSVRFQLRPPES